MVDKQKIVIFLLIVLMAFVIIWGISLKTNFEREILSIRAELSAINANVNGLENRIRNVIQNALEENTNRVQETEYEYKSIDSSSKLAVIDYTVTLESVGANAKIFLVCKASDGAVTKEVELQKVSGLIYQGEVEISMEHNYSYNIIERGDNGAQSTLNTRAYRLDLYDEFYTYRIRIHSGGSCRTSKQFERNFMFTVKDFDLDEYEMESAKLQVVYEDEIIVEKDVTNDIIDGCDQEAIEQYNMKVASGELSETVTREEFVKRYLAP